MDNTTKKERKNYGLSVLRPIREDAGLSLNDIADILDISKQTAWKWENGLACPDAIQSREWFRACKSNPLPYYLNWMYPERYNTNIQFNTEALYSAVDHLGMEDQRRLCFILSGDHGTDVVSFIQLIVAYLRLPLKSRCSIATQIESEYRMAAKMDNMENSDSPSPNMEMIDDAIDMALEAVKQGDNSYIFRRDL